VKGTNMFSQNDEEKHIVNFFKGKIDNGRFLDIGAYDGKAFSNTHRLALNGWSGVCFEPSESVFPQLEKLYADRDDVICDQRAVGGHDKEETFYDSCGDAISSFNTQHVEKWKKNWNSKFKETTVKVISFDTLFDKYGTNFDFINIDVEAANFKLFSRMDWTRLDQCKLFCIEHDRFDMQIANQLRQYGFHKILRNAENVILGRS